MLIARRIPWQRVSPAPPAPAQMRDSLSKAEGESEVDGENTSDKGGGRGGRDEWDDGLARLNDLDVTRGFDQLAFLQERTQEAPAGGDAGDGTAETMDSPQEGAVDAFSAPAGRAETVETMVRLKRARWRSPRSQQGGPKAI